MIRKSLLILSIVGLVLSVGLWGVTSFYSVLITNGHWELSGDRGALDIMNPSQDLSPDWVWWRETQPNSWWPIWYGYPTRAWRLAIPLWIPALAFAILPAISFVSSRRRRSRSKHGLCVGCAYDLRGTEGACPECGLE